MEHSAVARGNVLLFVFQEIMTKAKKDTSGIHLELNQRYYGLIRYLCLQPSVFHLLHVCRFLFLQHPGVLLRSNEGQDIHITHFSELTLSLCLNIPSSALSPVGCSYAGDSSH